MAIAEDTPPSAAAGMGDDARVRASTTRRVLRVSEADAHSITYDGDDDRRVIINMGPQHPSTHGVLRSCWSSTARPFAGASRVIGYLHTGMEKTGETLSYLQGPTNVTRMDYAAPLFSELAFSLATEKLLDVEIPERATWIRMLMCELNRMTSHLLFQATNGMDIGAVGMMIYGWREREEVLRLLEKITGLRMNHNYIRPGGVAADLPDGWRDDVLTILDTLPERLDEFDDSADWPADLAREAARGGGGQRVRVSCSRRDRPAAALDRLCLGSAPRHAVPRVRPSRLRRARRVLRRLLRPLRDSSQRDP